MFETFLLRQRVDAVIAVSLELDETEVSRLHALGKPIVGVGGPIPGIRTLQIDDDAAARLATEHLLALGHTSIAHIGGNEASDADFHMPVKRRRGFVSATEAAGIKEAARFIRRRLHDGRAPTGRLRRSSLRTIFDAPTPAALLGRLDGSVQPADRTG